MPEASPGIASEPGNQLSIANLKPAQPLEILRELVSTVFPVRLTWARWLFLDLCSF